MNAVVYAVEYAGRWLLVGPNAEGFPVVLAECEDKDIARSFGEFHVAKLKEKSQ